MTKMMKGIMNMMTKLLMRAILLLNLFLFSPILSYADDLDSSRLDDINYEVSVKVIEELKRDIQYLLITQDEDYIANELFGDCINHFIKNDDDGELLSRNLMLKRFNVLFDDTFKLTFKNLKIADNLFLLKTAYLPDYLIDSAKMVAQIMVDEVKIDDYQSTRLYWFYKSDNHWVFAGMTCVG